MDLHCRTTLLPWDAPQAEVDANLQAIREDLVRLGARIETPPVELTDDRFPGKIHHGFYYWI